MKSFYFSTVLLLFTISLVAQNNYILTPQKKYEEYKTSIRNNEWISFKIKYDNNSERTIICKNSNGKSQMLVSLSSDILMKVTQDTLIIINTQYQNYECYTKDERLKRYPNYASISPLGIYSDFSIIDDKPNYISKKDTNNNQYVIFTTIKKSISCDRIVYKNNKPVYINPVNKKNVYNNYFNTQNGLLEFSKIKDGERHHIITVEKYSFADLGAFVDSVFNKNNYNTYSFFDDDNVDVQQPKKGYDSTKLSHDFLIYPILTLSGDTTNMEKILEGWTLLDFCMTGCRPCFQQLEKFKGEKDSTGRYIIENNGIKLLFINSTTWRLDLLHQVADKYDISDSYAAKGITQNTDFPTNPGYVLISPSKDVVYKSRALGDYSELLKAKQEYELKHSKK